MTESSIISGTGRYHQRGLSLVELMVALVITMLFVAGLMQLVIGGQLTFRTHDALAQLQERGRMALELIGRNIRRADYWGCLADGTKVSSLLDERSAGYEPLLHDLSPAVTGDQRRLILRGAALVQEGLAVKDNPMSSNAANIQISKPNPIEQFDVLLVSDCEKGDVFVVTNASPGTSGTLVHNQGSVKRGPENASKALSKRYGQDAQVLRFATSVFQVDGDKPLGERHLENAYGMDLINGVEAMSLRYGEDTDGDGTVNRYVPWDASGLDWSRVVSVRVSLLLYSEDGLNSQPIPYQFDGIDYNGGNGPEEGPLPDDRRLRRSFTSTFVIRNRLD